MVKLPNWLVDKTKKDNDQNKEHLQLIAQLSEKIDSLNDAIHHYYLSTQKMNRENLVTIAAILFKNSNKLLLSKDFIEIVSKNPNLSIRNTPDKEGNVLLELVESEQ